MATPATDPVYKSIHRDEAIAGLRNLIADADARIERQRRRAERLMVTTNAGAHQRKPDPAVEEAKDSLKTMMANRETLRARLAEMENGVRLELTAQTGQDEP
jgi:hypothetical protein